MKAIFKQQYYASQFARLTGLGIVLAAASALPNAALASNYNRVTLNNGVMQVEMNGPDAIGSARQFPMITKMSIIGIPVIEDDSTGEDFQIAVSGEVGTMPGTPVGHPYGSQDYNPNQGGDCTGTASPITGMIPDWSYNPYNAAAVPLRGALLGIQPLRYDNDAACRGIHGVTPYEMSFGVLLGQTGSQVPPQLMVMPLSVRKTMDGNPVDPWTDPAPNLYKFNAELPTAYLSIERFKYVFTGVENASGPASLVFTPASYNGSNDVSAWPTGTTSANSVNINVSPVNAVMTCMLPDLANPNNLCMAFYSGYPTRAYISHRKNWVSGKEKVQMTLTGAPTSCLPACGAAHSAPSYPGSDLNWINQTGFRTVVRLTAVGNPATVRAAIAAVYNTKFDATRNQVWPN